MASFRKQCDIFRKVLVGCYLLSFCLVTAQNAPTSYRFKSITVNEQLSHSDVNCVLQDQPGYIWIGTNNGLNRFDGYQLKQFKFDLDDPNSLPGNRIKAMTMDVTGYIWIAIENKGVFRFHPQEMRFHPVDIPDPTNVVHRIMNGPKDEIWIHKEKLGLIRIVIPSGETALKVTPYLPISILGDDSESQISCMFASAEGVYIAFDQNQIWKYNYHLETFEQIPWQSDKLLSNKEQINCIYQVASSLWLGTSQGRVLMFDEQHWGSPKHNILLDHDLPENSSRNQLVKKLIQDNYQRLWIGTNAGLYLLNKNRDPKSIVHYRHIPDSNYGILSNQINDLYQDRFGILYIGTYGGGLDYTNLKKKAFAHIPLPTFAEQIKNNVVGAIYKSKSGKIWIGTRSGLYIYDLLTKTYETNNQGQYHFLNSNTAFIFEDSQGVLWIGTQTQGLFYTEDIEGQTSLRQWHDQNGEHPESLMHTMQIAEDQSGRLWVSTFRQGVFVIGESRQDVIQLKHNPSKKNSLSSNNLTAIYCDPLDGSIWVSTRDAGVNHITWDTTNDWRFSHYRYHPTDKRSLSSDHCWQVLRSSKGDLWIGTLGGGINTLDQDKDGSIKFKRYTIKNGLADNDIECFEEDKQGNLWLGGVGLSKFYTGSEKVEQYFYEDGLQSNSFKIGASLKDEDGVLYFGGINGVNYFDPEAIQADTVPPKVQLTGIRINDQDITPVIQLNGRVLLEKHITSTSHISLRAKENNIAISFVALQLSAPEQNQYQYQLAGLSDQWINCNYPNLNAQYFGLLPGSYTFKLRASNGDGIWSEETASLSLKIAHPWYATRAANFVYVLLLISILYLYRLYTIRQSRLQNNLLLAEKDRELDQSKLHFFTQVSHELRTPLTLIKGPLDELLIRTDLKTITREKLEIIESSTDRLMGLVNQLLDFQKMETGHMRLEAAVGNFVKFVKEIFIIFSQSATDKHVNFEFICDEDELQLCYDRDKMETVIMNLLHNAYKHTPENGNIKLVLKYEGSDQLVAQYSGDLIVENFIELEIIDSGSGVPANELDRIFTPYYQIRNEAKSALNNTGTGIGLSLVKSIIELHIGQVTVENMEQGGACFRLRLPFGGNHLYPKQHLIEEFKNSEFIGHYSIAHTTNTPESGPEYLQSIEQLNHQYKILIVEDNAELRNYLRANLLQYMDVEVAINGKEAYELIIDSMPDLVISDVMMPVMDGIQLCEKIKNNELLAHIPVILLTARTATVYKNQGLQIGAEDYITKPFSMHFLHTKILGILRNRDHLQNFYRKQLFLGPTKENRLNFEEKQVMEAIQIVENNLDKQEFGMQELSTIMGMSKSTLYRKIKMVTSKTAVEFIRDIRLRRAAQLLLDGDLNVKEIAYKVGFSDLKYFRKCFHSLYELNPSEFARNAKQEEF